MDEALLRRVVGSVLDLPVESVNDDTSAQSVEDWTSVVHLSLILALEEEFGIVIPDEDAAKMTSYPVVRSVVAKQLGLPPNTYVESSGDLDAH